MKKLLLPTLLIVASFTIKAQNAFYEAQQLLSISPTELKMVIDAGDPLIYAALPKPKSPYIYLSAHENAVLVDYIKFLNNPFDASITRLDRAALNNAIAKYNTFVSIEIKKQLMSSSSPFTPGTTAGFSLIQSIVGGTFSLSPEQQTAIIDGMTKYFSEEFQKARLLTYMQTFEATIGKVGELEVLFPKTYLKLKNSDPAKFPELGNEFKSIFNDDLSELYINLIHHIENHSSKDKMENKLVWLNQANNDLITTSPFYKPFKISGDIATKLINNYHPVDLFNYIDNEYYADSLVDKHSNFSDKVILILHGINLIQNNLLDSAKTRDNQFANVWIDYRDLSQLGSKREWMYFAGLIYQQDKAFFNKFIFDASLSTLANVTDAQVDSIKQRINLMIEILKEVESFRSNLKDDNLRENYIGYMRLILKSIQKANFFTEADFKRVEIEKYMRIADHTLVLFDNARKKDFSNSIHHLAMILNEFLGAKAGYLSTMQTIDRYGNFMTDVINAKDSEQVKETIKKFAAPPASFILKREYVSTLSLTGQPGYFVSTEKLHGDGQSSEFVSGITLPIGFELSFKTKPGNDNSSSVGLFVQMLDLGAVLNFRTSDSASELPDKIEFKQIYSPGVSISYGFKNSPATIAAGYQFTPELRKITLSDSNETYPNGDRFFLRLGWDIPFLNIVKSKLR